VDAVPPAADPGGCAIARRITASWRTAGRDDFGYGRVRTLPYLRRITLIVGTSVANWVVGAARKVTSGRSKIA